MSIRDAWPAALLILAFLPSCQSGQPADAPAPALRATAATPVADPAVSGSGKAIFETTSEPIEFVKIQSSIPRGALVGMSVSQITRCYGLRPYIDRPYYWNEDRLSERARDFANTFFYAAREAGFDVVGDPRQLFDQREDRSRATFAIAAEIARVRFEYCDHMHWFLEYRLDRMSGTSEIEVVWHVYDRLKKSVVHTETTTGRFELKEAPAEGAMTFMLGAFANAAHTLTERPGFRHIVAKATEETGSRPATARLDASPLNLARIPPFTTPLAQRGDQSRHATVTIDLGDGHGSGFLVDARGYVLTNYHVVGERKRVRVRLFDESEIAGEVLRRDKVRDVALIKIAGANHPTLPIRSSPAVAAEVVFAIGSPLDPALSSSVTKGVVSAIRRSKRTGLTYIQADVNIQGGNSGGPLVDSSGNILGISVSGIREEGAMIGINFFIPIHEALDRLNLRLADGPTT